MFDKIRILTRAATLAVAAASVLATAAAAQVIQVDPGKFRVLPKHQFQVPGDRILRPIACPDPAAVEIGVTNIRSRLQSGVTYYDFDVVGTVRNVGGGAWSSGRGQQFASLLRHRGASATLATRDFMRLSPGASFTLTSRMSLAASEEFPPDLEIAIGYDPDIRLDGNRANDDCRMGNNSRRLSGRDLMGRLHAGH
ncbi:MAG: hypothetical protein WDZ83_03910 [Rhizobiaceae bacterium]